MNDMHDTPKADAAARVRSISIADSLEEDIRIGRLPLGAKLPPQREMARRLGLSVGTVSRAYAEARRRGIVEGHVGRGTFVTGSGRTETAPPETDLIDLSLNSPPRTGAVQVIERLLVEIAQDGSLARLMPYMPHQGLPEHREALGAWMARHGQSGAGVMITQGAQHAISAALSVLAREGDTVLAEAVTFSGVPAIAAQTGIRLHGVALDREGLVPEALDAAFAETGARVVFATPTLQTPTGAVMSEARRDAVAEVVARHDAHLVEDDVYARYAPHGVRPIRDRIPERTFHVQSFAKYMAPALRVGLMVPPPALADRAVAALRPTGWMASPILVEVAARAAENGALDAQIEAKRQVAVARRARAAEILGAYLPTAPKDHAGFHIWLPMPEGRSVNSLVHQARDENVRLRLPLATGPSSPRGVRLCLGSPSEEGLERALSSLQRILASAEEMLYL